MSTMKPFSKLRQPTRQRLSNLRTQQTKISIGQTLFLYYEESLVSTNLNSKQLKFHGVRPNVGTYSILTNSSDIFTEFFSQFCPQIFLSLSSSKRKQISYWSQKFFSFTICQLKK